MSSNGVFFSMYVFSNGYLSHSWLNNVEQYVSSSGGNVSMYNVCFT